MCESKKWVKEKRECRIKTVTKCQPHEWDCREKKRKICCVKTKNWPGTKYYVLNFKGSTILPFVLVGKVCYSNTLNICPSPLNTHMHIQTHTHTCTHTCIYATTFYSTFRLVIGQTMLENCRAIEKLILRKEKRFEHNLRWTIFEATSIMEYAVFLKSQ